MKTPRAVVLMSGGLDSTVAATMAVKQLGEDHVHGLSIFYGQRHEKEIVSCMHVCQKLDIDLSRRVIQPFFFNTPTSALSGSAEMPHMTYRELSEQEGPSVTNVPFRNAVFISLATAYCMIEGYDELWIGVHAEDGNNFAYPDCTPEFVGAMANAMYVGSYRTVRLIAPLQWMMKKDVVAAGMKVNAPFELTWSCYEGRERACGKCPTCVERLHAFEANGLKDPINYEV